MPSSKLEDLAKKYEYRIDVVEDRLAVSYFTDGVDLSKPTFVSFAPRYRLSKGRGEEMKGQILTFPSHLVKKIADYVRA